MSAETVLRELKSMRTRNSSVCSLCVQCMQTEAFLKILVNLEWSIRLTFAAYLDIIASAFKFNDKIVFVKVDTDYTRFIINKCMCVIYLKIFFRRMQICPSFNCCLQLKVLITFVIPYGAADAERAFSLMNIHS